MVEPAAIGLDPETPLQFERQGYFRRDRDSTPGKPVFVRTVGLRDTFAKALAEGAPANAG
jgi:glutaminyl-tRNA synthetase